MFNFIANLVLVLSVLGVLVIFLRRLPEAIEAKHAQQRSGHFRNNVGVEIPFKILLQNISVAAWMKTKHGARIAGKYVWQFILEAKDLKQSQALAARLVASLNPRSAGVANNIKKADLLIRKGANAEAEQILIQIIRKHPYEYVAYELLAKIYATEDKPADVMEILEFLVRHQPENMRYLEMLAAAKSAERHAEREIE